MRRVSWQVDDAVSSPLYAASPGARHLPGELVERWHQGLWEWKAPSPVLEALTRIQEPGTRLVVTGQQPGFWGGALYSIYKAATAVALAERIREETGSPAEAVFWIQGDDTDWDEVAWGTLPAPDLSLVKTRWKEPAVPPRHWIGRAAVPFPDIEDLSALWKRDPSSLGNPQPGGSLPLTDGFARDLLGLFGDRGLVPLDSRWPELRQAGGALFQRYLQRHEVLGQSVHEEGERLRSRGAPAPLDAEAAGMGLFLLEGEERLVIDPATWEDQVRSRLSEGRADLIAPSVLLRAVLQDHLLGTAAQVVGETEAAYLRQIDSVYRELEVVPPARTARLHMTLLPGGVAPVEEVVNLARDPEEWIRERAGRHGASERKELEALQRAVAIGLDSLSTAGGNREVEEIVLSARRKINSQLSRIDETLQRRARQALYREDPRLRHLPEFLRPRRRNQDRGLSGSTLRLLLGDEASVATLSSARAHLDRLGEGALHHFVLEIPDA